MYLSEIYTIFHKLFSKIKSLAIKTRLLEVKFNLTTKVRISKF
nr:MAG TPA: hypothetical protein [Caudoviricetes sp.]